MNSVEVGHLFKSLKDNLGDRKEVNMVNDLWCLPGIKNAQEFWPSS